MILLDGACFSVSVATSFTSNVLFVDVL